MFLIDWEYRFEPPVPVFMQITRGGMSLFLSQHGGDCQVGGAVYLFIDDVDEWHPSFLQRGVHPGGPTAEHILQAARNVRCRPGRKEAPLRDTFKEADFGSLNHCAQVGASLE
ncbi:MAG TPA: glyoxalase superfamily protein [Nitrospirota bacterium]